MKCFRMQPAVLPALFLFAANASAQVGVALTAGVNRGSWDSGLTSFFYRFQEPVTRSYAGISATIPLYGRMAVELGGGYSQKGVYGEYRPDGTRRQTLTFSASYLEFTALGRFNLPLWEEKLLAFLVVGPAVARQSSCEFVYSSRFTDPNDFIGNCDGERQIGPELHGLDFGLVHGGGLEVGLADGLAITLGVVHSQGLRNLLVDEEDRHFQRHLKLRTMTVRGGIVYWID